ncbi:capsule assembly Wzi family protein [Aridibaculum aurantiacum]|uniref:capsule assembly Wzi family protein n=1 Tax=Aridibaculum aurantiacum TaxID=2810307 RepID=UPI001A9638A4|nr:capsule assembly Wzi family protein [Aridibaculum aurantiacum]
MQIKSFTSFLLFLLPVGLLAQSSYLLPGTKDYILVDRLEIKSANQNLNYSTIKPYNRRQVVAEVEKLDSLYQLNHHNAPNLTPIDRYNMERFLMNNSEWSRPREAFKSRKPIFNTLYKNKGNMLEVNKDNFFLAVNPLFTYRQSFEAGNDQNIYYNSRGFALRGMIDRRVGFHIYFTENQERPPLYVQEFISKWRAVPGAGFYKPFKKTGVDYFDVRGSVSWNVAKYIDMQFGYDKHFIGVGHRSLFLSDFSNNATFLKINTRIWKFNYQNLYMELIPDFPKHTGGSLMSRKYFRMNHLSVNLGKTVNVGLFDAVVFGRKNHFDFQYLLPVMFIRPAEQQIGSPDNALVGLDAKVNIFRTFQVYGQLMFDEFRLNDLINLKGGWANKYGYQVGAKYIDAFGVRNLDLQVESNRVRPFSYSHFDSVANYTHYNMPLAHPLGANFQEFVGIARAQVTNKLYLQAKAIYYKQGLDSAGINYGSNPFRNYFDREVIDPTTGQTRLEGYLVGSGNTARVLNIDLLASYEIRENMFFDVSTVIRNMRLESGGRSNATILNAGLRWNMPRRTFDF